MTSPILDRGLSEREMRGKLAYEADVAASPRYHDGQPRPAWDDLEPVARESWMRNPTARSRR